MEQENLSLREAIFACVDLVREDLVCWCLVLTSSDVQNVSTSRITQVTGEEQAGASLTSCPSGREQMGHGSGFSPPVDLSWD